MDADGDADDGAQAHKRAKLAPKKVEGKEAKSPPPPAEKVLGQTGNLVANKMNEKATRAAHVSNDDERRALQELRLHAGFLAKSQHEACTKLVGSPSKINALGTVCNQIERQRDSANGKSTVVPATTSATTGTDQRPISTNGRGATRMSR